MSESAGKKLYEAADGGRASEVSFLLRDHPEVDINLTNEYSWTALEIAREFKNKTEVVVAGKIHGKPSTDQS